MKAEDMGINHETGSHSQAFTEAEATMMEILADHIGKDEKIPASDLALQYHEALIDERVSHGEYQQGISQWKREIRYMVNHLVIDHDQALMSKAGNGGGYWIAESQEEVDEFYETFRRRAMTGLTKAARGKQAVLADMVKQLTFEFEDLKKAEEALPDDRRTLAVKIKPIAPEPAPVVMVSTFLDKMTKEPEKYANELRMLRDKFGKVLMPKEMFGEIQELSRKLAGVLEKVS